MSNAHASKQHGCKTVNKTRPKSKLRARRNKAGAAKRKEELRAIIKRK